MTSLQRERRSTASGRSAAEEYVSRWFRDYVDAGRQKLGFPLRHWRSTITMLRRLHGLPVLAVRTSDSVDGRRVRQALQRPLIVRLVLGGAVSALCVPTDPAHYLHGRSRHALRQKVRAAEQVGLRYREVTDRDERVRLIAVADAYERGGAVPSMRNTDARNERLLPLALWLLAEDREGMPLLLAVAAVDGDVAVLDYYRTLVASDASSLARYGAMPPLVAALGARGVGWLTETGRPHWVHSGVRQFQRKVGFRIMRTRRARPAAGGRPS